MSNGFLKADTVLALAGAAAWPGRSAATAGACGLDWSLPTNHLDGADDHGFVAYWEKKG